MFKLSDKAYHENCIYTITVHKKTINQFYG